MFRAQLLVLFLIFYGQKSSCELNLLDLVVVAISSIEKIQNINTAQSSRARISDLVRKDDLRKTSDDLKFEMIILKQAIQEYRDLIDWDEQCNAQWKTSPTTTLHFKNYMPWRDMGWNYPTNPQESDRLVSSSECLDKKMDAFRETIYRAFSELTNKAVVENKGCIGMTAVHPIHHLYIWAVKFEMDAAIKRAAARADRSSVNNVAQPSTPDYSIEFKEQYNNYTQILISSFESIQPRFSVECNNETTSRFEVGTGIELTGFLKETIFKYGHNECGSIWWSCNSIADPTYTDRCKTTWITKGAFRPYEYSSCRYLEAIDTCLTEDEEKYRYVDSTKLGFKGQVKNCSGPGDKHIQVPSSSSFRTCSCNSIRNVWRVHVGKIESDVTNHFIIVGVRFRAVGHTLTLEAAEGKLRSLGYVTDFRWIPLIDVESKSVQLTRENAHFFMESLFLGIGSTILTGIGLTLNNERSPSGFELKAYGRRFDHESGILAYSMAQGYIGKCESWDEIEFPLVRPTSNFTSKLATKGLPFCGYIKLKQSSFDNDFGQSTLPLFHSVKKLETLYPIYQVVLDWRGSDDNSGFITLSSKYHRIVCPFKQYVYELKAHGKLDEM